MSQTQWNRLKDVFMQAVELSGEARTQFLDQACGDDSALRNEVEALLSSDTAETIVGPNLAAIHGETTEVGDWIDQYRLIRLLGMGGMGEVFLAEQKEPVQRLVALKIINQFGKDNAGRMLLERQALARLEHSYIAKLFDAGTTENGLPFFAMEYVDGHPLIKFADENQLNIDERLRLMIKVCEGVHHAHMRGLIHRDLKPSNIMVQWESESATPKIIDFGIVKALDPLGDEEAARTKTGSILGTPAYMSPEQVNHADDVDLRTDIYALGMICYELLCGEKPFVFGDVSIFEVMQSILNREPPSMSKRFAALESKDKKKIILARNLEAQSLQRLLKGDLNLIVKKATAKERDLRYPSASDLAADFQRYLEGRPVLAHPPNALYLVRKYIARHRYLVGAAVIVVLSLIGGGVAAGVGYIRAERALTRADEETRRAQAINDFLKDMLVSADPRELGRDARMVDVLEGAERALNESDSQDTAVEIEIRATLAETYIMLGLFNEASGIIDVAVNKANRELGPLHEQTLNAEYVAGILLYDMEEYETALTLLPSLVSRHEQVFGPDHKDTLVIINLLAAIYGAMDQPGLSEPHMRRVYETHIAQHGSDNPDALILKSNLASCLVQTDHYDEGIQYLEELLEENPRIFGPHDYQTISVMNEYATTTLRRDVDHAIRTQEKAFEIAVEHLGDSVPLTMLVAHNLGYFYLVYGKAELAEPVLKTCMQWRYQQTGYASFTALHTERYYVSSLIRLGRHNEARELLERRLLEGKPESPILWSSLAAGFAAIGDWDKSTSCLTLGEADEASLKFVQLLHEARLNRNSVDKGFDQWLVESNDSILWADCADDFAAVLPDRWKEELERKRWHPSK